MGLFSFGKKKNGSDADEELNQDVQAESGTDESEDSGDSDGNTGKKSGKKAGKQRPKKKNDMMSSVLQESVIETVMGDFKSNSQFIVKKNGQETYVGLFFDTEEIGGLSKKSSRDEAKGSIIEAIMSSRMKVMITTALMDVESMVVIPDAVTLDCMSEFSILEDVQYVYCFVDEEGGVELTNTKTTLKSVIDLLTSGDNVADVLDEFATDAPEPVDDSDVVPVDDTPQAEAGPDDIEADPDDDMPAFSNDYSGQDEDDGTDAFSGYGEGDSSPSYGDGYGSDYSDQDDYDYSDMGDGDYGSEENLEEVPDEVYDEAMKRRFYSDDLELEVTTEAFDSVFLHSNSYIPFNENRPSGWINDYLNQMSMDANTTMRRMHQENLFLMREKYFTLVQMYCEDIIRELDYEDATKRYGQMYTTFQGFKADAMDHLDQIVSDRKVQIEDEFSKRLSEVAEAAAQSAMQQYRERYSRQHSEELYRIEPEAKAQIEDEFQDSVRRMNEQRREEAKKRLDLGINAALAEVSKLYMDLVKEETKRYKEYEENMSRFLDENRKDEIARSQTMAQELAQSERADAVMAEYTAKIQALTADFGARKDALQAEVDRLVRKSERDLKEKDNEYKDRLRRLSEENTALQNRVDELIHQMATLDESKSKEFEARIDELIGEREAFSQKYDHLVDIQKKGGFFIIVVATVAVVAAITIGFVAGEFVGIKRNANAAQERTVDDLESKLNAMDIALPEGWNAEFQKDENGKDTLVINPSEDIAGSDSSESGELHIEVEDNVSSSDDE